MTKCSCIICKDTITTNNLKKHHERCLIKGGKISPSNNTKCKYCERAFATPSGCGAHQVQCCKNPDRIFRKTNHSWNKGLSIETSEVIRHAANKVKARYATGDLKPTGAAAMTREQRSAQAKSRGFGGYRENAGRSKKFRVVDSYGKETVLQSTYELRCSQLLNDLGIKWYRPRALKYDNRRNYFADFYLPDHDIWLDPKNDYKAKQDKDKIEKVIAQNNVRLYVLLKGQLTHNFIASITQLVRVPS